MPLKPVRRTYGCSDATLQATADQIANCVTRDIADFAVYDIDAASVTTFKATITTFSDKTTDDESLGDQKMETDAKNTLRKELEDLLRLIRTAAQLKYGNSGKYRKFGFDRFTELSDNNLVRMIRRVIRVLTELQTEMTVSFPSVADKIAALTTKGNAFDEAVDAIIDKKNARDIATQARIIAGNAVYTELYRLTTIGKALYQDTNEAKYNDYVLGFQGGTPGEPANPVVAKLEGNVSDYATGEPVGGAVIAVLDEVYSTTSDAEGNYSLEIPGAGMYVPIIRAEGYCDSVMGGYEVTPGESTTVYPATLIKLVTAMVGTITNAATGLPVKDAMIVCSSSNFIAYSDAAGRYKYALASEGGTFTFSVSKEGYSTTSSPALTNIEVDANEILTKNFTMTQLP